MNKCDTCKHCGTYPSWYGHFHECDRLAIERDRMINVAGSALPLALVPADFGCVYHEPKPEKRCGNCEHWGNECFNRSPGDMWFHCRARSGNTQIVFTKIASTCHAWRSKP